MISLTSNWKEFGSDVNRSLQDDFCPQKYSGQDNIAKYLDAGTVLLVSPECDVDVFTNERIKGTSNILTDGEYSWPSSLSYYVREYNLRLPAEFEKKAAKRS